MIQILGFVRITFSANQPILLRGFDESAVPMSN
jgi:hypothetical protein